MVKEFVVSLENKPGTLFRVADALGRQNVNITAFACEAVGDFGFVRMITGDENKTERILTDNKFSFRSVDVLPVTMKNHPGELARVASKLAEAQVNIESAFGTAPTTSGDVTLYFKTSDTSKAKKALGL
jgi:hypothetical protein